MPDLAGEEELTNPSSETDVYVKLLDVIQLNSTSRQSRQMMARTAIKFSHLFGSSRTFFVIFLSLFEVVRTFVVFSFVGNTSET